jgi:hypothetical protein
MYWIETIAEALCNVNNISHLAAIDSRRKQETECLTTFISWKTDSQPISRAPCATCAMLRAKPILFFFSSATQCAN